VPDGIVNRFILAHDLGDPLYHSTQFYRVGEKLAAAGWLVGRVDNVFYFTPRESAKKYVGAELNNVPPAKWPVTIEVEAGQVVGRLKAR
jgi:predicted alpha/beta-hydrolase family hydrolase